MKKKRKIRATTAFKVIQGHQGRYQSKAHMRLTISVTGILSRTVGTTYDDHLGPNGKHVVDFLLMLIELFSPDVTAESLRAKRDQKSAILLQRGLFDPKFQVEGVAPHQSFLHS